MKWLPWILLTLWWTNPVYGPYDTLLTQAERQEVGTVLYNGPTIAGPWSGFATVHYGETMYQGLPGRYEYYCAKSELHGVTGPYWGFIRVRVPPGRRK